MSKKLQKQDVIEILEDSIHLAENLIGHHRGKIVDLSNCTRLKAHLKRLDRARQWVDKQSAGQLP